MAGQQAGHGVDHVLRVLKTAGLIQAEIGGDVFIITLAAWLHDVGDAKFHQGVELSAQFTREILAGLDVPSEVVDQVAHIVDNISFRKELPSGQAVARRPDRAGRRSARRVGSDRYRADDRVRSRFWTTVFYSRQLRAAAHWSGAFL
ncbi:MAG: HD domain-containing protein [Pirellulaceae bacterium]